MTDFGINFYKIETKFFMYIQKIILISSIILYAAENVCELGHTNHLRKKKWLPIFSFLDTAVGLNTAFHLQKINIQKIEKKLVQVQREKQSRRYR